jgi:hypothetical protein
MTGMIKRWFGGRSGGAPVVSFIIVAYDMQREIWRTLQSLQASYQTSAAEIAYEVIVVDNGSPQPLDESRVRACGPQFRLLRIDNANPSPVSAINRGAALARGSHIAVVIDGARILSPGVLYWSHRAFQLSARAVVSVLGFHLGPDHQRLSSAAGYSRDVEDRLLAAINWPDNGYRLFEIASLAGSSRFGWCAPLAESNCIVVPRTLYDEVGGFDERFVSPGGGLANLDFYKRCCEAGGIDLYHLVGEGCFHQLHGGVTTGGAAAEPNRYHHLQAEYEAIRGELHRVPQNRPILLGSAQPESVWLLAEGSRRLVENNALQAQRQRHLDAVGFSYVPGGDAD